VPLIKDILGDSLHRIEVRKGASAQDGSGARQRADRGGAAVHEGHAADPDR
jgi:hypothetical protein